MIAGKRMVDYMGQVANKFYLGTSPTYGRILTVTNAKHGWRVWGYNDKPLKPIESTRRKTVFLLKDVSRIYDGNKALLHIAGDEFVVIEGELDESLFSAVNDSEPVQEPYTEPTPEPASKTSKVQEGIWTSLLGLCIGAAAAYYTTSKVSKRPHK